MSSNANKNNDVELRLKKILTIPDTLVVLIGMIILATILTWVIPAGRYNMVLNEATKRQVVDPDSFHYVAQKGQTVFDMLMAIPTGLIASSNIMIMNFICGAAFFLITMTGAINAGLGAAIRTLHGRSRYLLLCAVMAAGLLLGLRGGAETLLPFVPIAITASLALGYDSITGVACIMLGGSLGFAVNWIGGTYIISAGIAGLNPLMQDVWYRAILLVLSILMVGAYIYFYTKKLEKDPAFSSQYESDKHLDMRADMNEMPEFTGKRKIIMVVFLLSFVALIVGALNYGWSINHFSAFYFVLAVVVSVVWGYSLDEFAKYFTEGCKTLMYGSLMVGFARVISVVMTDGLILDTFTHFVASLIRGLPQWATATGMFIVHCIINFLIPSGSGQAAVTMPIMVPLGDVLGLDRHVTVLAFQFGDCLTNSITPTAGFFMASLAMGRIPWTKWLKWYFPLFVGLVLFYSIAVSIPTFISTYPNF